MKKGDPLNRKKNRFILFVSGMSVRSMNAIENFRVISERYMAGDFELEIIDVTKQKHQATAYQVVALPTLIKIEPAPQRIIIGDLSDTKKVLKILNINAD